MGQIHLRMVYTKLISFVLPEHRGGGFQQGFLVRRMAIGKLFPDVGNMMFPEALANSCTYLSTIALAQEQYLAQTPLVGGSTMYQGTMIVGGGFDAEEK